MSAKPTTAKYDLRWFALAQRSGSTTATVGLADSLTFFPSPSSSVPLRTDWHRAVLASSGYLELGMLDDAVLVLEKIAPEDKTRIEVLGVCHSSNLGRDLTNEADA